MGTKAIKAVLASFLVAGAAFGATAAKTSETTVVEGSNRMKHRSGAYLGFLGDPYPTLVGVNVAYNAFDFMRATAGLGRVTASLGSASASATTLGAGARFFVPGWNISPTAGLSFAYVSVSSDNGSGVSVGNFDQSAAHVYGTIGVDWQAESGFNVGAGYNISFKSGIGGMPYVNLGWYFDFI